MTHQIPRPEVALTPLSRAFWTGGATGELVIQRCRGCQAWLHLPRERCPRCGSGHLGFDATSGKGTLFTYTVIHHAYREGLIVPFVIGLVELPEQTGLRVTSNVVGCGSDDIFVGMPLHVVFERQKDDIYVPLFEPTP
jgi:uncharacterized protein